MIFGSLTKLFKPSETALQANALYCAAVTQARQPVFYTDFGVADSINGRFDLIALHVFLFSRALMSQKTEMADEINQAMVDRMFADMDQSLREMGVGDVGVSKKVQKMAYALNGRMQIYASAWDDGTLADNLYRNVYRAEKGANSMAEKLEEYVRAADKSLHELDIDSLIGGQISWPQPLSTAA